MFGENSISFLDPKSKNIIEKAKVTDTDFEDFRTALVVAIKKTIQDRQVALSEVYQQLIGAQNIQEANTEIASLNEQISKIEAEKLTLAQQKTQKIQDLSKEERELKQEFGEKEKEIKELEAELEAKKNQAETILREGEILNQQKKEKEKEKERQIQVITTLALTGVIAGGIFWYTSKKKK
jgi:chromosome segregation ATPase